MIVGILIDPKSKSIREVEFNPTLESMQGFIGGMLEAGGYLENGDVFYVDEEGRLKGLKYGFFIKIKNREHEFFGRGLVLHINEEGDEESARSTIEELSKNAYFWKAV